MNGLEADGRADTFVAHTLPETLIDLGEIRMNYATTGSADRPALLLIPSQTESWWGYEQAMALLAEHFQVYAVDLRGQGRSTWSPGRYTLDLMGGDLVRFIDTVIGRPTIVSGMSSGGVLSAWLSAYAPPGQIRGAVWEDPPLFASETAPACGPSINQGMGQVLRLYSTWLGDQWSVGDWAGFQAAARREIPAWLGQGLQAMAIKPPDSGSAPPQPVGAIPQNLKEYDPEWARAFTTGTATASCDHARMLTQVRVPVLYTHHFRTVDEQTGGVIGASSDQQAAYARTLVAQTGQSLDYQSMPTMAHSLHGQDPELFTRTVTDWSRSLAT